MFAGNNIFGNAKGQSCSPEVLAKIADIIKDPVFITKNGGASLYDQKIIYANKALCEATGYKENEIIGRSPDFLSNGGGDSALEFYKNCFMGQEFQTKFESCKKDGSRQTLTLEITPIIGEEQGDVSYISYVSEVAAGEMQASAPVIQKEEIITTQPKAFDLPDGEEIEIPVTPVITSVTEMEEVFKPQEEVKTETLQAVEQEVEEIQPQETTAETPKYGSILEEIQAELRGERVEEKAFLDPKTENQETEEEDPFGLEDYVFGDEDDDNDLKEEYKLVAQPETAEETQPEAPQNEVGETKDENTAFFAQLGNVLNNDNSPEPAAEEGEQPTAQEPETDPLIAGTPDAAPYQSTQITALIKKLEEKKQLSMKEPQFQRIKEESEHPDAIASDLDYHAKAQFLSNMSHDLRTPLNAIIGFSEVIRDQLFGPIDNQRYLSYANDIFKSGQELLATVSEILELSEIDEEESPLEEEKFSLSNNIDEVLDLLSARAFQTDVKLMKKLKAENIVCFGDRRKVKQAIAGVVNNAIKCSPSGGTLELSTEINGDGNFQMMVYIRSANMIAAKSNLGSLLGTVTSKIESEYPEILLAHKFIEAHGGEFSIFNSATSGTEISMIIPSERISRDVSGQDYIKAIN